MKRAKKLWAVILAPMLMLTLMNGCAFMGQEAETPPLETETNQPSTSVEIKSALYITLSYCGIDTNPQRMTLSYDVVSDSEFVTQIWNELDYKSWTERQEGSVAQVAISLSFSGGDNSLNLEIDPNDVGWLRKPYDKNIPENYPYFDIPAGTYERIKNLLTEYTSEYFMPEISIELLDIDTESDIPISFVSGEITVGLSPERAGEFTEDWQTDTWEELKVENMSYSSNTISIHNIYSKDGRGPVDITIDKELLLAVIHCQGLSKIYEISPDVTQVISRQFDSFRQLGQW